MEELQENVKYWEGEKYGGTEKGGICSEEKDAQNTKLKEQHVEEEKTRRK